MTRASTPDAPVTPVAVQDSYPPDVAVCYGCGRLNDDGLHIRTFWDGTEGTATFQPKPFHTAITGVVYALLLSAYNAQAEGALFWINLLLHYVAPLALFVDWLIDPPATALPFRRALLWVLAGQGAGAVTQIGDQQMQHGVGLRL